MLRLTVPAVEYFDETKQEFVLTKEYELHLEHSLVSLSKWESKWCKPFLSKRDLTREETIDYVRCMTINNVGSVDYKLLPQTTIDEILKYIEAPMTATTLTQKDKGKINKEVITAEIVYYWMIAFNIPVEFQKWHLNRLLTLINVCNIKNQPQKKMTPKEIKAQQAQMKALNDKRRAELNTKG